MRRMIPMLALAASCAVERGESGFDPQNLADVGNNDASAISPDIGFGLGSGAGTMAGTWLLVHEASTCVVVDEQVTWASYLVHIDQDGRTLIETREQCEVALSAVFGLEVLVPDAVLAAIEFIEIDTGFVSTLGERGTYTSSTELSMWGIELENALTDPVPSEPDDPAVVDSDNDGNPGLTFGVVGSDCERYTAQRTVVRYFGNFTAPNQIDGGSVTVTDTNVVGSSQSICGVNPRITPNDPFSKFRMVRVDGAGESINLDADGDGTITCAEAEPYVFDIIERRESTAENCN